jgi:hypothetical protein
VELVKAIFSAQTCFGKFVIRKSPQIIVVVCQHNASSFT